MIQKHIGQLKPILFKGKLYWKLFNSSISPENLLLVPFSFK